MRLAAAFLALALPVLAPAPASASWEGTCDPDDIECIELWYWLGETVFLYELGAVRTLGEHTRACMEADSQAWRRQIETTCTNDACAEAAHRDRLAALHDLQAGVFKATGLGERDVPELLTILAPEDFPGEPEPLLPAGDFAEGNLVWAADNIEHMGLAIDSGAPAPHVMVFDMDIGNQPGHDLLLGLIEAGKPARLMVRGTGEIARDGVANFDPRQCRFVYRLPG